MFSSVEKNRWEYKNLLAICRQKKIRLDLYLKLYAKIFDKSDLNVRIKQMYLKIVLNLFMTLEWVSYKLGIKSQELGGKISIH